MAQRIIITVVLVLWIYLADFWRRTIFSSWNSTIWRSIVSRLIHRWRWWFSVMKRRWTSSALVTWNRWRWSTRRGRDCAGDGFPIGRWGFSSTSAGSWHYIARSTPDSLCCWCSTASNLQHTPRSKFKFNSFFYNEWSRFCAGEDYVKKHRSEQN